MALASAMMAFFDSPCLIRYDQFESRALEATLVESLAEGVPLVDVPATI